jgi:hypothetical protein
MKLIAKGSPALDVSQYAVRDSIDSVNHYDPTFGLSTQVLANALGSGGADGGFSPLYQFGGPRSAQLALKLMF